MSTQDLLAAAGLVGSRVYGGHKNFQIKKIEINPWKTIVRAIGRALTAEAFRENGGARKKARNQK